VVLEQPGLLLYQYGNTYFDVLTFLWAEYGIKHISEDRRVLNIYRRNLEEKLQSLTKLLFSLFNRFYRHQLPSAPPF
jgi:hypothetical protein